MARSGAMAGILVHRLAMVATLPISDQAFWRRETFRQYMRKLNPTAAARAAIREGLVLKDLHGSLFRTMAARADLEPGSQQLLVGGTGSGKTTELLLAQDWLSERGETLCLYIDISAETDLAGLNSGALLAGFGLHLGRSVTEDGSLNDNEPEFKSAKRAISEFAYGTTKSLFVPDDEDNDYSNLPEGRFATQTIPGKLVLRFPAWLRDVQGIYGPLEKLTTAVQKRGLDVVVIFDGLDRLISPDKFLAVVDQDLRALRRLGVAVIAVAPQSVLYGDGRSISEHFERVHHMPLLNPEQGNNAKLKGVLAHRGGTADLLGPAESDLICAASGGVLRDLIALARDAGEAAYIAGSDNILPEHTNTAIKQLGQSYLRGLGPEQLKTLRRLHKEGSCDVASPSSFELLATGRVLEYSPTDFKVHPALWPLVPTSPNE